MDLALYYAPIACSLVTYVTLNEAGAEFEVRPVNIRARQQMSAEYLKLNPKHKVPVLVVDGRPLTENVAIQIWIARHFTHAQLLPSDPWEELQVISLLAWCASGIHPVISRLISPAKISDMPEAEESVRRLATEQLFENLQLADTLLSGREYFHDHFTVVDPYFFWLFRRGKLLDLDQSEFTNCEAHFERMMQRPSVQKVLAHEKEVRAAFANAA